MYYARALCQAKNPALFGQDEEPSWLPPEVQKLQRNVVKTVAVLGGIIVIYESIMLVRHAHHHVKAFRSAREGKSA